MSRIRSLLAAAYFLTCLIVFTLVWGVSAILTSLFCSDSPGFISCARRWARGLLRAARVEVRVEGLGQLAADRSYVFMANHQSHFDVMALLHALPFDLRAVAKKELARVPVFGWALAAAGFIFVDRSNRESAIASLQRAAEVLRAGRSILVFAEGTRSPDGTLLPFKKGGFMMALECGAEVVPVAVTGSRRVLAKHSLRVRPGTIRVRVMAPIRTASRGPDARDSLMAEVRVAMEKGMR